MWPRVLHGIQNEIKNKNCPMMGIYTYMYIYKGISENRRPAGVGV